MIEIYCDGGYSQLHKVGSYGVVLVGKRTLEFSAAIPDASIARMELLGAIVAIESVKKTSRITVVSDSRYLVDGANIHLTKWKANDWRTCQSTRVSNKDLWLRLLACCAKHAIIWEWVKGHSGHSQNERADFLAREALLLHLQENA